MTTWLQHVKEVHKAGSTSFKESLKRASASWKAKKGKAPKKAPKKAAKEEPAPEEEEAPKPKKKRRKRRKVALKIPAKVLKNIDSRNLR